MRGKQGNTGKVSRKDERKQKMLIKMIITRRKHKNFRNSSLMGGDKKGQLT